MSSRAGYSRAHPLQRRTWIVNGRAEAEAASRKASMLTGAAFVDQASLFTRTAGGSWTEQQAGDHVPVAQWQHPNFTPLFELPAGQAGPVWLRLRNQPAPTSAFVRLLTDETLQHDRQWTHLLLGGYLGFGGFLLGFIQIGWLGDTGNCGRSARGWSWRA